MSPLDFNFDFGINPLNGLTTGDFRGIDRIGDDARRGFESRQKLMKRSIKYRFAQANHPIPGW
jgi:hypothetical protein